MIKQYNEVHTSKLRTFVPQLRERRDRIVYQGRIGEIGATKNSRYRLVALTAAIAVAALLGAALLHPLLTALVSVVVVAFVAGGWPIATGVAELRQVPRLYSHSTIVLLSGLVSIAATIFDTSEEYLRLLPAIAAVGILASFIVELVRGEEAIGRLESVISCISGVFAAVSTAGWIGVAKVYESSHDALPILAVGIVIALAIGAFGVRLISAGPKEGPRRGALTLGVTPVAFVGALAYVIAIFLTPVVG